jgi:hypothetical protein
MKHIGPFHLRKRDKVNHFFQFLEIVIGYFELFPCTQIRHGWFFQFLWFYFLRVSLHLCHNPSFVATRYDICHVIFISSLFFRKKFAHGGTKARFRCCVFRVLQNVTGMSERISGLHSHPQTVPLCLRVPIFFLNPPFCL